MCVCVCVYRTVLEEADVADDDVGDGELCGVRVSQHAERVLAVDARLQAAELALLAVVVERRHQHHHDDRRHDRHALDPVQAARRVHLRHAYAVDQKQGRGDGPKASTS